MTSDTMQYSTIIIRIILSVILGGLIGLEREVKNRPAGFRTHILVCVGSTTIMVLSELLFEKYYMNYQITADPARLAAQVISGVGFLGAGTIIHYGSTVKGLTTAASLWVVAAIGLTVGAGFYFLAISAFLAITGVLYLFSKFSHKFNETGRVMEMLIEIINKPKAIGEISLFLGKMQADILDMSFLTFSDGEPKNNKPTEIAKVKLVVKITETTNFHEIIQGIQAINGVVNCERV